MVAIAVCSVIVRPVGTNLQHVVGLLRCPRDQAQAADRDPLPEFLNPEPGDRTRSPTLTDLHCSVGQPFPSPALYSWISHGGQPLTPKEMGQRIAAVTRRGTRHAGQPASVPKGDPNELAIHHPEHVRVAQALPGPCRLFDVPVSLQHGPVDRRRSQGIVR